MQQRVATARRLDAVRARRCCSCVCTRASPRAWRARWAATCAPRDRTLVARPLPLCFLGACQLGRVGKISSIAHGIGEPRLARAARVTARPRWVPGTHPMGTQSRPAVRRFQPCAVAPCGAGKRRQAEHSTSLISHKEQPGAAESRSAETLPGTLGRRPRSRSSMAFNTGGRPRTLVGNWQEDRVLHVRPARSRPGCCFATAARIAAAPAA